MASGGDWSPSSPSAALLAFQDSPARSPSSSPFGALLTAWHLLGYSEPFWRLHPPSVTTPGHQLAWRYLQRGCSTHSQLCDALLDIQHSSCCKSPSSFLRHFIFIQLQISGVIAWVSQIQGTRRHTLNACMLGMSLLGIH